VARRSFAALGCRDVARIDLRLDEAGRVNFIECNPLPGLAPDWSDLCMIARAAGMSYGQLIGRILVPALRRAGLRSSGPGVGATTTAGERNAAAFGSTEVEPATTH
jgi:D-alanine-D-alanine ligase